MSDLALAVEDVHGHEDRPELQAGQEEVEEREAVVELDGEAVAGAEAAPVKDAGHPRGALADLPEREREDLAARGAGIERRLVRPADERGREEVEQRTPGHRPSVTGPGGSP